MAWITSRQDPWRRTNRDTPVQPGDLVAFEAGVVLGGYSGEVGRTHAVREGGHIDAELAQRASALWDRLLDACQVGAPLTGLLTAYDAAGEPPPPMPVARGLGLGFDLPLVTHALPLTAGEQHVEAGMVLRADRLRLEGRRRRAATSRSRSSSRMPDPSPWRRHPFRRQGA